MIIYLKGRKWSKIRDLNESVAETSVVVRARLHNSRGKGMNCTIWTITSSIDRIVIEALH